MRLLKADAGSEGGPGEFAGLDAGDQDPAKVILESFKAHLKYC